MITFWENKVLSTCVRRNPLRKSFQERIFKIPICVGSRVSPQSHSESPSHNSCSLPIAAQRFAYFIWRCSGHSLDKFHSSIRQPGEARTLWWWYPDGRHHHHWLDGKIEGKAWLHIGRFLWVFQLPIITKDHTRTFHVICSHCPDVSQRCAVMARQNLLLYVFRDGRVPCTAQWLWRLWRWRSFENTGVMLFNPALHCFRHGCHEWSCSDCWDRAWSLGETDEVDCCIN